MNDAYLDRYQALILEHFEFPIHPLIIELAAVKCDMKIALRKHMVEYNQRSGDRITNLTAKMKACMDIDLKLSSYYFTLHCHAEVPEKQQEIAFSVCNQVFGSMKVMLTEYHNQVFRKLGYA